MRMIGRPEQVRLLWPWFKDWVKDVGFMLHHDRIID